MPIASLDTKTRLSLLTQSPLKADEEVWEDDYRENKRKPRKYRGMEADERAGNDRC
jgi:hypothetical protein